MFTVRTCTSFDAVHSVPLPDGAWEDSHAHVFQVEVEVQAPRLDEAGCVIDFHLLDGYVDEAVGPLKGVDLAAHSLFNDTIPSAEGIAYVVFKRLGGMLKDGKHGVSLLKVTVWEDDRHAACFGEAL